MIGGKMGAEKLLTVEDAAKALLVKPTTIREWLKSGKLRGVKMGRLWRVRESEIEAFLKGGEKE
jgi:excisionase family DNA binding protein